jgi:hypothetical protein
MSDADLKDKLRCAKMLSCGLILHSEAEAKRAKDIAKANGLRVPRLRVKPLISAEFQ